MGLRFTAAHGVYHNHMVHTFAAGDELPDGELAEYLRAGGAPIEETDAAPADGGLVRVVFVQSIGDEPPFVTDDGEGDQDPGDQDPDAEGEQGDEGEALLVPDGSIATVLLWVGLDPKRAAKALDTERDKGDNARVGLVAALEKQLAATFTI